MKKITYLLVLFLVAQTTAFSQTTPMSAELEAALGGIDSNGPTGDILNSDAEAVTGTLGLGGKGITDFMGIEAFINITAINANYNNMSTLDLSASTQLITVTTVGCANLTSLTLPSSTALEALNVGQCALTSLDVSANTGLVSLIADQNELTGILDLSSNVSIANVNVEKQSSDNVNFTTLIGLDMRNGANGTTGVNADFNNNLACIYVDDINEANLANWDLDMNTEFCLVLSTQDRSLSAFNMYPNPVRGSLNVQAKLQASLKVYSISGKLVLVKELGFGQNRVNVSSLSSGVYLARFTADGKVETKKLIVN